MKFRRYSFGGVILRRKRMVGVVWRSVYFFACAWVGFLHASAGQQGQLPAPGPTTSGTSASGHYLTGVGLPYFASVLRDALPGIFDQTGHERRILQGLVSAGGISYPFTSTRQLDESVRLDLGSTNVRSVVIRDLQSQPTIEASSTITAVDYDVLETLEEDSVDAFLYSFANGARVQWIGANFSPSGVTHATYRGPYYDVFGQGSELKTRPNNPTRNKLYLFDSGTKLLAATRYEIQRNGSTVSVEVVFSGWTKTDTSLLMSGTIVRKEDGQPVFTITVHSIALTPAQVDSTFKLGGLQQ